MHCTVVWTKQAEAKLADIWLHEPGQAGITAAANWLDQRLRTDPHLGQADDDGFVLLREPLKIRYSYSPSDCLVTITDVRLVD